MPRWAYDDRIHNYRDLDSGRILSRRKALVWTSDFLEETGEDAVTVANLLIDGALNVGDWHQRMRDLIKSTYISEYMAGRGGLNQMTPRDWGILGYDIRDQYQYLDNFAQQIANGELTPGEIRRRASMYISGAHQMYERGKTEARGMPRLPAYPADGNQECLTNDRCTWKIVRTPSGWDASWLLDPNAEHCSDCPANARIWNPLKVPAGMTEIEADLWRARERERMMLAHGH